MREGKLKKTQSRTEPIVCVWGCRWADWGEFLLKFDLGPHVASLVMSTPLFVKLFMCGEGGAQVLG